MNCEHCPIKDRCLSTRFPVFCEWAASGDATKVRHVVERSAMGLNPQPRPKPSTPTATVPAPIPPDGVTPPGRRLVVSRFREDLAWLGQVPEGIETIVYNKGTDPVEGAVSLPNLGREAGTILHHIIEHYHILADVTIFCQGCPFDHSPDFLERLTLPYDKPTTLTTRYLESVPDDWIKAKDLIQDHHGFEIRYGDASVQAHSGQGWFNPSAWEYLFTVPMPKPLWFGYAATWAVPRGSIRSRPLEFWQHLLADLDGGGSGSSWTDPPLNPWTMEALWRYVFDPAYPTRWKDPEAPRPRVTRQAGELVMACPYRKPSGCNCGPGAAQCSLFSRRVGFLDCVGCLRRGDRKRAET